MKVRLKLFATFRRYLPPGTQGSTVDVEVPPGTQVGDMLSRFDVPEKESRAVLVNGRHAEVNDVLKEGDVVAAFPAIGGG